MDDAGLLAVDLVRMTMNNGNNEMTEDDRVIILAAECLKDICIVEDNNKLKSALASAKMHSENLYWINERMGQI